MASRKSRPKRFRIEMGWGGLLSLSMASLVMLLWMFVLGFWAGKRLLGPVPVENVAIKASAPVVPPPSAQVASRAVPPQAAPSVGSEAMPTETLPSAPGASEEGEAAKAEVAAAPKSTTPVGGSGPEEKEAGPQAKKPPKPQVKLPSLTPKRTWFALRVASVKDKGAAEKEARRWKQKGYEAFVKRADLGKKGVWYRIYVGHYATIQEAKRASEKIPGLQYITPFND